MSGQGANGVSFLLCNHFPFYFFLTFSAFKHSFTCPITNYVGSLFNLLPKFLFEMSVNICGHGYFRAMDQSRFPRELQIMSGYRSPEVPLGNPPR